MSDNIKVVVKVRPLISRETDQKLSSQWLVKNNTLHQLDLNGSYTGNCFTFDKVYDMKTQTLEVYNDIAKPIVEAALSGFNGTIFAYGQTSSGKTYTMSGTDESPGIIPLAVLNLFDAIKSIPDRVFLVRVSYMEIYNETVKDLLDMERKNIRVRDSHKGVKVEVTERPTASPEEVLAAMKEGEANRQTGATNMNEESSRSHSIFQITIESRENVNKEDEVGCVNVSQLNLVDLAGSERSGQTGATGIRFKEGTHINKSLSTLALVIKQLSEDVNNQKFINYRDSKLTRILQNSLGGNAKTSIICAITPASVDETISTLQFANRAKAIKNTPEVNVVATNSSEIHSMTKKLSMLQSQLESKKNLEQDNVNLQKQIATLQKLILNGFGQNRVEMMASTRRKFQQPRRATISTLQPIEESPGPKVPKFCTPSLKYNPLAFATTEFVPLQSASKLNTLHEESRMVTPPPTGKRDDNDIIEVPDSDDDTEVCSPYHKCRQSVKTPPCVLKANAKKAEKNYKDIVELTTREKMFTPHENELYEKLEQKTNIIIGLEEQIENLTKQSTAKDLELEQMKEKINKTEEQVTDISSAKSQLEAKCNEINMKLIDLEVSYETLIKKAKTREDELLSLLDERKSDQKPIKPVLDKELRFMDLSKDISLVNSDDESSVTNDGSAVHIQDLVTDLQTQLIEKNQMISKLEANIFEQKQQIESLDSSSKNLQSTIDSVKEKLSYIENENEFLKSTVDSLTSTIESQKSTIEAVNKDIQSYNDLILDLKTKLTTKDNIQNVKHNDALLETIVANEEKLIHNNENMKNILQSFRVAIDTRNKEIEDLRQKIQENTLAEKDTLTEEIERFRSQIDENTIVIKRLMEAENQSLIKITELREENESLKKDSDLNKTNLENMQKELDKITKDVLDRESEQQKHIDHNKELLSQIESLTRKNTEFENNTSLLRDKISDFVNASTITMESIINNLKLDNLILPDLSQINDQIPDNLGHITKTLEQIAIDIGDKKIIISSEKEIAQVKEEFNTVLEKQKMQLTTLQTELEDLRRQNNEMLKENNLLREQNIDLTTNLDKIRDELTDKENLVTSMMDSISESKELNDKLGIELRSKDDEIQSLNQRIESLMAEIVNISESNEQLTVWKSEVESLKSAMQETRQSFEKVLKEKDDELATLLHDIRNSEFDPENTDILILIDKLTTIIENKNLNLDQQSATINLNSLNELKLLLVLIAGHISKLRKETDEYKDKALKVDLQISEMIKQKEDLTKNHGGVSERNKKLLEEVADLKLINKELFDSTQILELVKSQLKAKTEELESVENQAKKLKDQLEHFDVITKQQMRELQEENEKLKEGFPLPKTLFEHRNDDTESKLSPCNQDNMLPLSLVTISFNKVMESLNPSQSTPAVNSSTNISVKSQDAEIQTQIPSCENCKQLSLKIKEIKKDNRQLKQQIKHVESINASLLQEQEDVRSELQLLVEPALELQKRIINHRTNLSTLTATTYAENKLLNSQLKVLKHHHTRYIHVCQKDLPMFKTQLNELMTILKGINTNDKLDNSFKRYSLPDVLDNNTSISNYKNESTLDGDLLMLDTNITLTAVDNTLMGHDQTCLDVTQINFDSEVACQTSDVSKVFEPCQLCAQIELVIKENQTLNEELDNLKLENMKLKEDIKNRVTNHQNPSDVHSPIKPTLDTNDEQGDLLTEERNCKYCLELTESQKSNVVLLEKTRELSEELDKLRKEKDMLEKEFRNLQLEVPQTDVLATKLSNLEKDYNSKVKELSKLSTDIKNKNSEIKLQEEEINTLSNQLMDNITESDGLKNEVDELKQAKLKLEEWCQKLDQQIKDDAVSKIPCSQCLSKDELIASLRTKQKTELRKLNRSLSDSESSSTHNKLSTLQQELHASKEDCIKITEEVVNIKKHLDQSNFSNVQPMDLDESMGDSNIFSLTKGFEALEPHINKFNLKNITEEATTDLYTLERNECLNFLIDKTGSEKENLSSNIKIIDVMKKLYNNLVTKHNNEVENLLNKLKDMEESRSELNIQIENTTTQYSNILKELENKDKNINNIQNIIDEVRNSLTLITDEMTDITDTNQNLLLIDMFKENVLTVIDSQFGLNTVNIYKFCMNNLLQFNQENFNEIMEKYTQLQNRMEEVLLDFNTTTDCLNQLKSEYAEKEKEYNLLKTQKEKVQEICNAVTLDIVKKEQELSKTISLGCKQLLDRNMMEPDEIDLTEPADKNIKVLFSTLINKVVSKKMSDNDIDKENLILDAKKTYTILQEKEKELETLKSDLLHKDSMLEIQISKHSDLNKQYDNQIQELKSKNVMIEELSKEIEDLKKVVEEKEAAFKSLENKQKNMFDMKEKLANTLHEIEDLKSANEIISKENDSYKAELENSSELIKKNKMELDKMMSDILVLRESMKDNKSIIDSLKEEAKALLQQNVQLKSEFESKCQDCSRLELNIKTYEKSAEIQSKIIIRLQKQKEEDALTITAKDKQIEELNSKYSECQKLIESTKIEIEELTKAKTDLESRISELESEIEAGHKPRFSIDALAENTRRRRQSIHDSKRLFGSEVNDHNKADDVFGARSKPDDLFMDVDDDGAGDFDQIDKDEGSRPGSVLATRLRRQSTYDLHRDAMDVNSSNKSSPARLSKGRDSFHSAKNDHSDNEDETSRPSSVNASRIRRQSIYDMNREIPLTSSKVSPNGKTDSADSSSEIQQLRNRLEATEQELMELREQYKELDDECETCAQYLRERDEQCDRLKREKAALEDQVQKLKNNSNINTSEAKPSFTHAAVNTDEDWTNLHSVVVDRMSFDAEVEKNKKLTRTVEDLRYKKQELKNMIAKMQKTIDKYARNKENRDLESTRSELKHCKQELFELKQRYQELDEECDTCSKYLREREEQCVKLRDAKTGLENQVIDLTEKLKALQNRSFIEMKKRGQIDTNEDWGNLHSKVVDRMSFDAELEKNKKLTKCVDELRYQKQELRNALAKMQKVLENHPNAEIDSLKSELKDKEEQCQRLIDAKEALEAKLLERQDEYCSVALSARKKRQSVHDQKRGQTSYVSDASTETSEDFTSYKVERDNGGASLQKMTREVKHLKLALDRVTKEKAAIQQLASAQMTMPPMYVATGSAIVQNQQITDVMRENQKLKKINSKLISMCKKRGKTQDENIENES